MKRKETGTIIFCSLLAIEYTAYYLNYQYLTLTSWTPFSQLCKAGTLDPMKAKGKILVCLRGDNARVDKGEQALLAGAAGMILANNELSGNEILADPHVLPALHINYTDGSAVFAYINSTK